MRTESLSFKVDGMNCDHCKKAVETALKAMEGVTGASVYLDQEIVKVDFDPGSIKRDELKNAIKKAGYRVVE